MEWCEPRVLLAGDVSEAPVEMDCSPDENAAMVCIEQTSDEQTVAAAQSDSPSSTTAAASPAPQPEDPSDEPILPVLAEDEPTSTTAPDEDQPHEEPTSKVSIPTYKEVLQSSSIEPSDASADRWSWLLGYGSVVNNSNDPVYVYFSDGNESIVARLDPGETTPDGADWADHVLVGAELNGDGDLQGGTWYKLFNSTVEVTDENEVVTHSKVTAIYGGGSGLTKTETHSVVNPVLPTKEDPRQWSLTSIDEWVEDKAGGESQAE